MIISRQLRMLHDMYSKHLVTPKSIELQLLKEGKSVLGSELTVLDLSRYDHDHFLGVDSTQLCIEKSRIEKHSLVLDVGSGLGGPARYIAYKTGCKVLGIEIQKDRFHASKELTFIVGLQDQVRFYRADIASIKLPESHFTHAISFLTILHVLNKKTVLHRIARALKPKGRLFLEDYCSSRELSRKERTMMRGIISCDYLFRKDKFLKELERSGMRIDDVQDMTSIWHREAGRRCVNTKRNFHGIQDLYGKRKAFLGLSFAEGVKTLFDDNIINGVRILASVR